MFLKTNLDTEKEEFFAFLWLIPPVPFVSIFVLCLCHAYFSWTLLVTAVLWFSVWGYIYRNIQTEICFEGEKITVRLRRKIYTVSAADVIYIEEKSFLTNPLKPHEYKIFLQPNTNIPSAYLFIRNKKIQKNLKQLFPNVPVKQDVVL